MKSLKDISWQVSEEEYRRDPALSYSTLAKYERSGFNGLKSLFDKQETASLTFGSAVDSLITGGQEEFDNRFLVTEYPNISDNIITIIKELFNKYQNTYNTLNEIPDNNILEIINLYKYQPNWKPETRVKVIKEKGSEYYNLLYLAKDKTIISGDIYRKVLDAVDELKTSKVTKFYFEPDNPFDNIERLYQLKFKSEFNGIKYRCMLDLVIVDHDKKIIQPVDLKTSSKPEWDFYKSFIEWNYQIQNRLYYRILLDNIGNDDYFKDFTILEYQDIVINKETLVPLVWDCPFTYEMGDLRYGRNGQIVMRDPFTIGKELTHYLSADASVPIGIERDKGNNLLDWISKL